jgi:ribonucleoside-diphosphate reductase alpha chain
MMRHRLPNRRAHETIEFWFRGLAYAVGVGRFPDGSLAEIFVDCSKGSSPLAADARDAAVCLSIALQYRVPPQAIREAVTREANGQASGIVGAVLDLLEGAP